MGKYEYTEPQADDTRSGFILRLIVAIGLLVLGAIVLFWFPADYLIATPVKIPAGILLLVGSCLGFLSLATRKSNPRLFTIFEVIQIFVVVVAVALSFIMK